MCLNTGTLKPIDFPLVQWKLMVLGIPLQNHFRVTLIKMYLSVFSLTDTVKRKFVVRETEQIIFVKGTHQPQKLM